MPVVIFIAWWLTFLAATALLVAWQWRLARQRTETWDTQLAYATAVATTVGATTLVYLIAVLILALIPPAPIGRALGILCLAAWGGQCRDRWVALGSDTGPGYGRRLRQRGGAWVAPRQRGRGSVDTFLSTETLVIELLLVVTLVAVVVRRLPVPYTPGHDIGGTHSGHIAGR